MMLVKICLKLLSSNSISSHQSNRRHTQQIHHTHNQVPLSACFIYASHTTPTQQFSSPNEIVPQICWWTIYFFVSLPPANLKSIYVYNQCIKYCEGRCQDFLLLKKYAKLWSHLGTTAIQQRAQKTNLLFTSIHDARVLWSTTCSNFPGKYILPRTPAFC